MLLSRNLTKKDSHHMIPKILLRWFVVLLVSVRSGLAQVTIPDTPAGHTLQAWLDAFNSGDRAKVEAYVKTIDPSRNVDGIIAMRNSTGGFELLSIESNEPLHIPFRVKEKNGNGNTALGNFLVKDGQPPTVTTFMVRGLPPGVVVENVTLDAAQRKKVIDGVISNLKEYYIEPALAQQMADALKAHEASSDYNAASDGDAFAAQLTKDLREVSHDKHLVVVFSPFKIPPRTGPTPEDELRIHQQMEHDNCGFEKVEILSNNIGYVKFNAFMDASFCGPTAAAAMAFVAHTDAIIFDLRQNGGGQPTMVTLIASYLFDQPTHLIDMYNRKENSTKQNWTLPYLPGPRLTKQPVFVLTSKRTFSGAEEFAFDLKNQKRATIIGETTGGGAHGVSGHTVADYFTVGVPFGKSLDPVTKTNWEGTGVEPDVKVPAADALETAEKLAMEKLQEQKR
jgi:hypothetical protein